ncbi:DUF882 domain-containing protein [Amorphus sp. MBR-141]
MRKVRNAATALIVALSLLLAGAPAQAARDRTLDLFFTHTGEKLKITYKRNGRFIPSALTELNRFLRDWRRNESTKVDPELFDLLWQIQQGVGQGRTIHVVSAYRSPATNNMLRSRSRGVAKFSQHMAGKACDFYIPGVSTAEIRKAAFKLQVGGVGFYPTSRTPFVHLDTGSVRSWPRMTRSQLLAVFPDGKTVHLPDDGKPLKGYELAKAELAARDRGARTEVASASSGGGLGSFFGGGDSRRDSLVRPESGNGKNIIASLLGRDNDDVEDTVEREVTAEERSRPILTASATRSRSAPEPQSTASSSPASSSSLPGVNLTAPDDEIANRINTTPVPAPAAAPAAQESAPPVAETPSAPPPVPTVRPVAVSPDNGTPAVAPAIPTPAPEIAPAEAPTPEAVLVAALPKPRPAHSAPLSESASQEAAVASLRERLDDTTDVPVFGYASAADGAGSGSDNVLSATAAMVVGPETAAARTMTPTVTADISSAMASGTDPTATFFGAPDRDDSRFLIGDNSMRTMQFAWLSHPHQGEIGIVTAMHAPMGGSGALSDGTGGLRTDRFEGIPQVYITQASAPR